MAKEFTTDATPDIGKLKAEKDSFEGADKGSWLGGKIPVVFACDYGQNTASIYDLISKKGDA